MRRISAYIPAVLTVMLCLSLCAATALAGGMGGGIRGGDYVPHVRLKGPFDEVMDLTDKDSVTFRWSSAQRPTSGREKFQFRLFRTRQLLFDNIIISEDLSPRVKEFTVSADIFENGKTYVWAVRQKSRGRGGWSGYEYQSFEVVK